MNGCTKRRRSFSKNLAAVSRVVAWPEGRPAVWGVSAWKPWAPSRSPSKRFGVWDPHENPGHRPKNRHFATACDRNCFQISSTMSLARKKFFCLFFLSVVSSARNVLACLLCLSLLALVRTCSIHRAVWASGSPCSHPIGMYHLERFGDQSQSGLVLVRVLTVVWIL